MANAVMADSISYLPEYQAWYNAIVNTLGSEIDLSKLLVYMIDTVDASAIPFLAYQFDVLGYKGMRMAQTEADQRNVLKSAIELHRYKGTEWAIQQALLSIGFANVVIKKGIAGGYDHWAKFGLDITNSGIQLTASSFTDIINMVAEYKRAVCVLMDVSLTVLIEDTLNVGGNDSDEAYVRLGVFVSDYLHLSGTLKYDGTGQYNGEFDHSGDSDIITITQQ